MARRQSTVYWLGAVIILIVLATSGVRANDVESTKDGVAITPLIRAPESRLERRGALLRRSVPARRDENGNTLENDDTDHILAVRDDISNDEVRESLYSPHYNQWGQGIWDEEQGTTTGESIVNVLKGMGDSAAKAANHSKSFLQARSSEETDETIPAYMIRRGRGNAGSKGNVVHDEVSATETATAEPAKPTQARRSLRARGFDSTATYNYFDTIYYVNAHIGTPSQTFSLVLDTGSGDLWVPSDTCTASVCQKRHLYSPSKSSSARNVNQRVTTYYGLGSATGNIYVDVLKIGGKTIRQQVFIAADTMNNAQPDSIDGLLGLSFSSLSRANAAVPSTLRGKSSIIESMYIDWSIDAPAFGIWLSPADWTLKQAVVGGELAVGSTQGNPVRYTGPITWLRVPNTSNWWHVSVTGIRGADGVELLPSSRTAVRGVVDTGTLLIVVDYAIAKALNEKQWGAAEVKGLPGVWTVGCDKLRQSKNGVTIYLGGTAFTLDAADLPVRVWTDNTKTCYAPFQARSQGDVTDKWILGEILLRKYYQIYDYGLQPNGTLKPRVGLALATR